MVHSLEMECRVSEKETLLARPTECPRCQGARKVFVCARWMSSNGHCCPGGTHRLSCPGHSVACLECGGPDS